MSKDMHLLQQIHVPHSTLAHGIYAIRTMRKDIEEHFSILAHNIEFVVYKRT